MAVWPAAILFDFDGVIVNSEPLHFQAFHEVLKDEGVELTETEYYQDLLGFDDRGAVVHLFEKRGLPLEPKVRLRILGRKTRAMQALIQRRSIKPLPGVEQLVRGLWRQHRLAICSGALGDEIDTLLQAISLRDCFSVIVSADDVTQGKPHPEGYLLAAKLLGEQAHRPIAPKDCLIIEDAPQVIEAVKHVGFKTLGVAGSVSAARLAHADWVVSSLNPAEVGRVIPALRVDA